MLENASEGAPELIRRLGGLTIPMPVDAAFGDALQPGRTRVMNAGISVAGEDIAMRFEFEPGSGITHPEPRRSEAWQDFLAGAHPSSIRNGVDHWAIELPTAQLMARMAREVDESMNTDEMKKLFTSTGKAWGEWHANEPAFKIRKTGMFESMCSGLDVRAELISEVRLSVPADNTLRQDVEMEIDIDDWDAWKCIGVSLINPLAGIITVADNSDVLPWEAAVPIATFPTATAQMMIAWGLGLDDAATLAAIKEAQGKVRAGQPAMVRTSLSSFYTQRSVTVQTAITRNWLVLKDVAATGSQLIMRGDFTAPDLRTLPRLRGTLVEPFGLWGEKNKCSTNPTLLSRAIVDLALEDAEGDFVTRPVVPVRYGIDIEIKEGRRVPVGQVTWRIVGPHAAEYSYPRARTAWSGIPGQFEVELQGYYQPALGRFEHEVIAEKPLQLHFFTGYGVREFRIPGPPPLPRETAEQAQQRLIERANNCYVYSTIFTRVKALQVFWLPRPPEDGHGAQHWQLMVGGLGEGRRLRAWNARTGERLADVTTLPSLTEVSLVIPATDAVQLMQFTLDDTPLLDSMEYERAIAGLATRQRVAEAPVLIRQTVLHHLSTISLAAPAVGIEASQNENLLRLDVLHADARSEIELDRVDRHHVLHRFTRDERIGCPPTRESGESAVTVERSMAPRETRAPGSYLAAARPWFDRGTAFGAYFARLSDDGRTVELFHRSIAREAWPAVGGTQDTTLAS
jgi:hypothetical protein